MAKNILTKMQTWYPQLHINEKSEYNIKEKLNTTLQVSEFPIHEYEPIFELKSAVEDITKDYADDLYVDDQYRHFQYVINEDRKEEGAPKALVFQGSYMNGMCYF